MTAFKHLPGSFPNEMKVLTSLNALVLSAEHIDGTLPDPYSLLPDLETFLIKPINASASNASGVPARSPFLFALPILAWLFLELVFRP